MDAQLAQRLSNDAAMLETWGACIARTVKEEVHKQLFYDERASFFKIPVEPRVKSASSFIDKALYRGKQYDDPYEEITDKVGVRFVVLLQRHICMIEGILVAEEGWVAERVVEQDFRLKRQEAPEVFGYESVHYIVRAKTDIKLDNAFVRAGTPCEVQIRTLLQHASAELLHNAIYKPKTATSPGVRRIAARSNALAETTDELFTGVYNELEKAQGGEREMASALYDLYEEVVGSKPTPTRVNDMLLDALKEKIPETKIEDVKNFASSNPSLVALIKERRPSSLFFQQPSVLFVYLLADRYPNWVKHEWPIRHEPLQQVFTDLGQAYDRI